MNEKNKVQKMDSYRLKDLIQQIREHSKDFIININIEKADIHLSDLQDVPINFNFEKVDVKENSGSINFGNNLNETSHKDKMVKKKPKKEKNQSQQKKKDKEKNKNDKKSDKDIVVKVNNKEVDEYYFGRV
ncbi:hypothetical protein HNQ94_001574 [Salirhabdus euzebyi]|uniref:Uncharacterized protein n=1 Tax=Salirhabdus euzebyi TaxID=394506 RepID=A0A841Q3Y7_9BACI|nr:hypothetical protein [Salirhabdus euzebyi]MBB6453126.1 hypothetical protein [Salirhabdus euzebyi]